MSKVKEEIERLEKLLTEKRKELDENTHSADDVLIQMQITNLVEQIKRAEKLL